MAYLFLDDSKHHRSGFSLAAFAICDVDPTEEMGALFREYGFDPGTFEFKSSATMKDDNDLQALRDSLKHFIARNCKMALCVVDSADVNGGVKPGHWGGAKVGQFWVCALERAALK